VAVLPADLDGLLKGPIELRCLGGFVVTQQYGIGRETSDIDFLGVVAQSPEDDVETLAGLGSKLHRKYRLYMQYVGVVTPPADYANRLIRMFPSAPWKCLRLFALGATDIGSATPIPRRAAPLPAQQAFMARQNIGAVAGNGMANPISLGR
jgi:hypothetical protein